MKSTEYRVLVWDDYRQGWVVYHRTPDEFKAISYYVELSQGFEKLYWEHKIAKTYIRLSSTIEITKDELTNYSPDNEPCSSDPKGIGIISS